MGDLGVPPGGQIPSDLISERKICEVTGWSAEDFRRELQRGQLTAYAVDGRYGLFCSWEQIRVRMERVKPERIRMWPSLTRLSVLSPGCSQGFVTISAVVREFPQVTSDRIWGWINQGKIKVEDKRWKGTGLVKRRHFNVHYRDLLDQIVRLSQGHRVTRRPPRPRPPPTSHHDHTQ